MAIIYIAAPNITVLECLVEAKFYTYVRQPFFPFLCFRRSLETEHFPVIVNYLHKSLKMVAQINNML